MRIPITMSHGTNWGPYFVPSPHWRDKPHLDAAHFEGYLRIAKELGFQSISYSQLAAWRSSDTALPDRSIMFDFDHPNASIRHEILPLMQRYGYRGNLFINTAPLGKPGDRRHMTWDEIRELVAAGWHIGAHLHHHYDLAYLGRKDPTGGLIREQMERCDRILEQHLGVVPRDFAYTGDTWSPVAEAEARKRYRFARLWIIGAFYSTEQGRVRYAELVGMAGPDEPDGGPPLAARYITRDSDPYRLPSMDLEHLLFEHAAFRRYLEASQCG